MLFCNILDADVKNYIELLRLASGFLQQHVIWFASKSTRQNAVTLELHVMVYRLLVDLGVRGGVTACSAQKEVTAKSCRMFRDAWDLPNSLNPKP